MPDAHDWATLYRLASRSTRRLLGNFTDAEDAAQETMLRAHRAFQAGAEPANLEAWITTIATREAYRIHGRRKPSGPPDVPLPEPAAPDHSEASIQRLVVRQVLDDIPPDARELLLRRFALDQTSSEIATCMNLPAATVRVRLHRMLRQLQGSDGLGQDGVEQVADQNMSV